MTRVIVAVVVALCAIATTDAVAQEAALQGRVDALYPIERLAPSDASERSSCFEVLERDPAGRPHVVVAVYVDGIAGAVRVLRRSLSDALDVVQDSPNRWALPGNSCVIRLRDVDFDDQPEVFVYFQGRRASTGWIFRWDGDALTNLTPTEADDVGERSVLLSPAIYDLAHQGPLQVIASREIVNVAPGLPVRLPAFVYRLGPSGYEVDGSVLAVMGFRADVDPRGNQRSFRLITDTMPPVTLHVINGDRYGDNRVTSASIRVNEVELISGVDVNADIEFANVEIAPAYVSNTVTATLTGPPEGTIIVLVKDATNR